jgi:hypothetical protein
MAPHMFHPGRVSSQIPSPPSTLSFGWLLCEMIERQPPKANTPPSLYFLMPIVLLPQTRELAVVITNLVLDACNRSIGSDGMMIWERRCHIHGERAKLLGRAAASAHFDCCVCCVCVCGCVLCVGATFSYQTGRKSTSVKANWPTFAGL